MTDLNQKPLIHKHNPELGGSLDPRFKGIQFKVPAKEFHNDANGSDMELMKLYSTGPLRFQNTGKTCSNCMNWYPDPKTEIKGMGRCKARGLMRTHADTPAVDTNDWTDPVSGSWFNWWPGCYYYSESLRMSRK